jgi:hypothetical protein
MYFQPYPLGKWSWDWISWDQKSFFRRSKVEYNVFWTFNLMKNAAIGWSNHYCNLRSHEKGKTMSNSWWKKLLISCFDLMKFGLLTPSHPLVFCSYFLVFRSYLLVFRSYSLVFRIFDLILLYFDLILLYFYLILLHFGLIFYRLSTLMSRPEVFDERKSKENQRC